MSKIKIGCQTYTWEMLGKDWKGTLDDILDMVADAGYQGIEISNAMIGDYYERPKDLTKELKERDLELACFACASPLGWTNPAHRDEEMAEAAKALSFAAHFPDCVVGLSGASSDSRENLEEKFDYACKLYNEIGKLGKSMGVAVNCHPHSHHGSIIETEEEYDKLMRLTDPDFVQFGPDTGHIVRGGQNLVQTVSKNIDRIKHIHFKDVTADGEWVALGEGICDFPAVFEILEQAEYSGWVICEEESEDARRNQVEAINKNRKQLKSLGY